MTDSLNRNVHALSSGRSRARQLRGSGRPVGSRSARFRTRAPDTEHLSPAGDMAARRSKWGMYARSDGMCSVAKSGRRRLTRMTITLLTRMTITLKLEGEKEDPTENKRSTARRSQSDRRGNERRGELHVALRILERARKALTLERRGALRRIEYRRSPLDRRAPYRHGPGSSLETTSTFG